MLGLHTTKGLRVALVTAVVGTFIGIGVGAATAADTHAESSAQAIKGSGDLLGQIFGPVLDGGVCSAVYPGTPDGAPAEKCGDNLTLGGPTQVAYTQNAK